MYYPTDSYLTYAIKKATVLCGDGKQFSSKNALSAETLMRLLVGAEGGNLDKILHAAGIEVTSSAVPNVARKSRPKRSARHLIVLTPPVRTMICSAIIAFSPWTARRSIFPTTLNPRPTSSMTASLTAFNYASRVCREVIIRQPKDGAYAYRVNFKMAVMLCREYPNALDGRRQTPRSDCAVDCLNQTGTARPARFENQGFPGFVYRVAA